MMIETILLVAACVIAWLVFNWLLKVVKTTVTTALTVAVIVLILQITVGIGPRQVWQQILDLPQVFQNLLTGS